MWCLEIRDARFYLQRGSVERPTGFSARLSLPGSNANSLQEPAADDGVLKQSEEETGVLEGIGIVAGSLD